MPTRTLNVNAATLFDTRSRESVPLSRLVGDKGIAIFFTGNTCPVARAYEHSLPDLIEKLDAQGVNFVVVNSNDGEGPSEIRLHISEAKLPFRVYKDVGGRLASELGATRTSETVLLSTSGQVVYQGRIDDKISVAGARRQQPTRTELLDAVADLVAGRPIRLARQDASGCFISRGPAGSGGTRGGDEGQVTYADVAPILQRYCVNCHQPGQVGPMSLLTYDDVSPWSTTIEEVIEQGRMPPWRLGAPDPRFGDFESHPAPSAQDVAMIKRWIAGGELQGPPIPALEPTLKHSATEWLLGKPDRIAEMPVDFDVPAHGIIPYRVFLIHTEKEKDRWIESVEFQPQARSVVHHMFLLASAATPPAQLSPDMEIPEPARPVSRYIPALVPRSLPPGYGYLLRRGESLYLSMHYTPDGVARRDRSRVGLRFARQSNLREFRTWMVNLKKFEIPPHAADHVETVQAALPADAELFSVGPHMHLRGESQTIEAIFPDGKVETLLAVPKYNFEWQQAFYLKKPRRLPKGTIIRTTGQFDNSARNPYNPDPSKTVRMGQQTTDEMLQAWLELSFLGPVPSRSKSASSSR